jgi:hypothetical protein
MASLGLNVSRDGHHDPSLIRGLGATWLRIVATPEHDLRDYFRQCRAAGLKILLVLARESGGDYAGYAARYASLVDAWQVGNEADLVSPSSWTMTPAELAALGRSVRAILPRPHVLVCAGMASGQPEWLDGMDISWCDALAVHGYLKDAPNPDDIEDLPDIPALVEGYRAFGKPVIMSEWGWWGDAEPRASEEVRDMIAWAARTDLIECMCYFCADDLMVPPFGLLDARGREKPRGRAFKEQAALAIHSLWPDVEPVPMPTRDDVIAASHAAADAAGIPRLLLLSAGIAESNLRPDARRPTDPARDAAAWPDCSYGPWQQTARWSEEYHAWIANDAPLHPPGQFPGSDVVEAVFDHYRDLGHAARVAARQLKAHYRPTEDDAIWRALNRYNFPAGYGEPKTPGIGQNYRRGIKEAEEILGVTPVPGGVVYEAIRGQPSGRFDGVPKGVILHGSRSGRAGNPKENEYKGTASWAASNPDGLGWHATIGEGKVAVHLTPQEWGWNARVASRQYVAVEIAQATIDDPITDAQIVALADYLKTRIFPVWGHLDYHFPTHSELELWGETGQKDGKSDIYMPGDPRTDTVRNRLYELLGAPSGDDPPPPPPVLDTRIERARAKLAEAMAILEEVAG